MFHQVARQHMQGVVGSLITALLQIYYKNRKSVKIWQNCGQLTTFFHLMAGIQLSFHLFSSASEVTTLWRYTICVLFIIILFAQ